MYTNEINYLNVKYSTGKKLIKKYKDMMSEPLKLSIYRNYRHKIWSGDWDCVLELKVFNKNILKDLQKISMLDKTYNDNIYEMNHSRNDDHPYYFYDFDHYGYCYDHNNK